MKRISAWINIYKDTRHEKEKDAPHPAPQGERPVSPPQVECYHGGHLRRMVRTRTHENRYRNRKASKTEAGRFIHEVAGYLLGAETWAIGRVLDANNTRKKAGRNKSHPEKHAASGKEGRENGAGMADGIPV